MKPLSDMTKRELIAWAEANGLPLSSTTRESRAVLERAVRRLMQQRYRDREG